MGITRKNFDVNQHMRSVLQSLALSLAVLAVINCRPAMAGHWVVDHYKMDGENYGSNYQDPNVEKDSWDKHEWDKTAPPESSGAGNSIWADWEMHKENQEAIYAEGSYTPVFRWVPDPNKDSDPPTKKFYVRLESTAMVYLTSRTQDFDHWQPEVTNSLAEGVEPTTIVTMPAYNGYEQKFYEIRDSRIEQINNTDGSTTIHSPTTPRLKAKIAWPNRDEDPYRYGSMGAGVGVVATPVADIKVNSSIEDSTQRILFNDIPFPNEREKDGSIKVDTAVTWSELGLSQEGSMGAWTFNGTFVANPFPAGLPLGFSNPEYTWSYTGPNTKGYIVGGNNVSLNQPPLRQHLFDKSKADMSVYFGDVQFNQPALDPLDPALYKKKYGATFPVSGTVVVGVIDKDDPASPPLTKNMDVLFHLPAEEVRPRDRMSFNGVLPPLTYPGEWPADISDTVPVRNRKNQVSEAAELAGQTTGFHFSADYIVNPDAMYWTQQIDEGRWEQIAHVLESATKLGVFTKFFASAATLAKAYQFANDPVGGWVASGTVDGAIELIKGSIADTRYSSILPKTNDSPNFQAALSEGRVTGIYMLHPDIIATIGGDTYKTNKVWAGCKMDVDVIAPTKYQLYWGHRYGPHGYEGRAYLHTRLPMEPKLQARYTYITYNSYWDDREGAGGN